MTEDDIGTLLGVVLFVIIIACMVIGLYPQGLEGEVSQVSWQTVNEVESYIQVYNSGENRPPRDAYNVSSDEECTTKYNQTLKTWQTTCTTTYYYTVDRWVHVRDVVTTGTDRNPEFPYVDLYHVETGYGNERLGKQKVYYIISGKFNNVVKECSVSKDMWDKAEEGMYLKTSKSWFNGIGCNFKLGS